MGVYESNCSKCGTLFMWWSGDKSGLCSKCINEMGGGYHEIEQKYKNPIGCNVGRFIFIGFNEAETYDDAVKLVIEQGVPEDEIVKNDR